MQAAECRTDGKNYANSKKNETLGNRVRDCPAQKKRAGQYLLFIFILPFLLVSQGAQQVS